ncbi:Protein Asterix [Sciurus carolinensis]|uniref:PAT complex subunit Asterix n=1 Tax=Sciurus carolinensis TaxID=30640 RepID=A0AA41MPV3_SCICA|nr:Protein Asterix [Sciurus carolinensis]
MSTNNMSDPRRPNKVLRYKPPPSECNPALDDPTPDYMNLLGMIFSMCGLMLKVGGAVFPWAELGERMRSGNGFGTKRGVRLVSWGRGLRFAVAGPGVS